MGKSTYLERKEAGVCARCGTRDERVSAGRVYCAKCVESQKEGKTRSREYRKSRKRCVRCGEKDERTQNGFTECGVCAEKEKNSPARIASKERYNEAQKKLRRERREAGVCTKCGMARDMEGYLMCSVCLAKQREYLRGYVHGGAVYK